MKRLFVISILLCCCTSSKGIKIKINDSIYSANLPPGFSYEKEKGEIFTEKRFIYPDEAIFYITDDTESGGAINTAKVEEYGTGILVKIAINDSMDISGQHIDNTNWREKKLNGIVVGYIHADAFKKQTFDKAIIELRK